MKDDNRIFYPAEKEIKAHRPSTRRGHVIRLMSRPEGATIEEMAAATDWTREDLLVTFRMINAYLGHGIQEDDTGHLRIVGTPRDRKVFNFPRKDEIRTHRINTKRSRVLGLLSRPEGVTMEEVQETIGWNTVQAFQGVILIHTYLGHGLREDEEGRIYLDDSHKATTDAAH